MQYNAPKKVASRGLIRTRYKIAFLLTGVVCLYAYHEATYKLMPKIASEAAMTPQQRKLMGRQSDYPYNAIWLGVQMIPAVAAGRMAEIWSAKWILFTSLLLISTCLSVIPFAVSSIKSSVLLDGITGIMSLCNGCVVPAAHVMLARWTPPKERFAMGSLVYSSFSLGKAMAIFINIWWTSTLKWKYVFYTSSAIDVFWLVMWVVMVQDDPSQQENMSEDERQFLHESLKVVMYEHKRRIESIAPWKALLTSPNTWAIVLVHVTLRYADSQYAHRFAEETQRFRANNTMNPIAQAVILTMPNIWSPIVTILSGLIFLNLTQNGVKKVQAHRIGTLISLVAALCHVPYNLFWERSPGYNLMIICLLMVTMSTFMASGFLLHLEMAPNYAGTLMGLTLTLGGIPSVVFMGVLGAERWNHPKTYFSVGTIMVSMFMGIVYFSPELETYNNYERLHEGEDYEIEY